MLIKGLLSLTLLATLTTAALLVTCPTDGLATLDALVNCFERYTVPRDYYTCATYNTAQPSVAELKAWRAAIIHILNHDDAAIPCTLPESPISALYGVFRFTDSVTHDRFCVLHEKNAVNSAIHGNRYKKGWGLFITPDKRPTVRRLHHSAPHPLFDTGTARQAAAVFQRTVSKSLLIEGRHRHALSSGDCSESCQGDEYHRTDGAHDNREPFHTAMIAIHSWQSLTTHGGCPLSKCSYLQWHGKNDSTCLEDRVFLSNGFVEPCCYSDPTLPVNRIKTELNLRFTPDPPWHHVTPPDDPLCTKLTGTDNLFGRYINGVRPVSAACTTPATSSCSPSTSCGGADFGQFVHIEQDSVSRDPANWDKWAQVISGAFPPPPPLHITDPEQQVVM